MTSPVQPPPGPSAVELANQIREREAVRVVGWLALGVGMSCWFFGGMFWLLIPAFGDPSRGTQVFAVLFGLAGLVGCTLAARAIRWSRERTSHAVVALAVNVAFVVTVEVCVHLSR